MSNFFLNTLKIVGSDKQIFEVRKFISGTGDAEFIDFNNIIPVPEKLKKQDMHEHGRMALKLLFGVKNKFWIESYKSTREQFDKLSLQEKQCAVDVAFEYIRNEEEFGSGTLQEWIHKNWGTLWGEFYDQRLFNDDEILFATKNSSGATIIERLSKEFPNIEFKMNYSDEHDISGELIFKDGLKREKFIWEEHPCYFEEPPTSEEEAGSLTTL